MAPTLCDSTRVAFAILERSHPSIRSNIQFAMRFLTSIVLQIPRICPPIELARLLVQTGQCNPTSRRVLFEEFLPSFHSLSFFRFLLTIPKSVGYEMNPLKVYYCYDLSPEGGVDGLCGSSPCFKKCIAEVTNTPWGEKVFFEFCPGSDVVAKPLHVSPFMDMAGNWIIHAEEPGENLFISISVQHPILGNYFIATLTAKRIHSSTTSLNLAMYFWLMPHKVAVWIYWQAVKIWWKNIPFIGHPKYSNPSYRDDALSRDNKLCPLPANGRVLKHLNCVDRTKSRWCIWKDAEWPWT